MTETEEKNQTEEAAEEFPAELGEPRWSVISFAKSEASSLTYPQAEQKLAELNAQKVSGLCIVTDEVALRMKKN